MEEFKKQKERLSEKLLERLLIGLGAALLTQGISLLSWIFWATPPEILALIPLRVWYSLCIILLLISIALLTCCIFLFKKFKTKLTLKHGIYWDKEKNPYCVSCKKPLTGIALHHSLEYFMANCVDHKIISFAPDTGFKTVKDLKDSI